MLVQFLEQFDLSSKEARIYLALLELGSSPVSPIAEKSGINRSTSYVLLNELGKKGFVSVIEKQGLRLYTSASPEKLVELAESRAQKHVEILQKTKDLVPHIKLLEKTSQSKPKVQMFEGVEGLKTAFEDTLTSKETIRAYASTHDVELEMPDYFPAYFKKRVAKKISVKAILPDIDASRKRVKFDKAESRRSLIVSSRDYAFTTEINIYDDKVSFFAIKEKFALIIQSRDISNGFKKMFDFDWKVKEAR